MNASMALDWLIEDTEKNAGRHYHPIRDLEKALRELNNRHANPLPRSLPKDSENMVSVLREHFKDNVTFISLVLNHYFPDRYFFYRVSSLEREIFEGFDFLKAAMPQFEFKFPKVGRTGFARYLQLNNGLLDFARRHWPRDKKPQQKLTCFVYQGLGRVFREREAYTHRWVMAAKPENCEDLDAGEKIVSWSARKETQPGDLVFLYRTSPRKAITDILRVKTEPVFDPWGAWDGFWADLDRVCEIEDIPFAVMRKDPILGDWGTVKKFFVGTVTEPIPPVVYNRLLEKIAVEVRAKHNFKPEIIAGSLSQPESLAVTPPLSHLPTLPTPEFSGQFSLEAEFEEKVIVPLMKRWQLEGQAQHTCLAWIGSQEHQLWVDFLVSDDQGLLTLFEDKLRIMSDQDLEAAVEQAKSYALLLGLPSFVVASPEGLWLYSLQGNREELSHQLSPIQSREQQERQFRDLLLEKRSASAR